MYNTITNPMTGRKVSIYGKLGKSILNNYIQTGGADDCRLNDSGTHCITGTPNDPVHCRRKTGTTRCIKTEAAKLKKSGAKASGAKAKASGAKAKVSGAKARAYSVLRPDYYTDIVARIIHGAETGQFTYGRERITDQVILDTINYYRGTHWGSKLDSGIAKERESAQNKLYRTLKDTTLIVFKDEPETETKGFVDLPNTHQFTHCCPLK